jgi:acyl carrier protein
MTTLERLQGLLHKDFDIPVEALQPDARLEDLDIDSLRMIEIVFSVEEQFGIRVAAEQAELKSRLQTFGDLVAYVESLLPAQ